MADERSGESPFYRYRGIPLITGMSLRVRKHVFREFMKLYLAAGGKGSVCDVGVTSETVSEEANFFEKLFPFKDRMTAVGVEEASALETQFPGLKYVSVAAGSPLPFPDGSFDWVFSHAVIEHIVDDAPRGHFVSELLRVARKGAMITTPNRYFWVETHTMVPFLHFAAPRLFNLLMDKGVVGAGAYSTSNLRLLSAAELVELGRQFCPAGWNQRLVRVRTAGLVSNLLLCLENPLASTV